MIKNRKAKIVALTVGLTLALGFVASPAGAQTIAELQAQINALMAQLAALQGSSAPSMTFTQNLTLGSTGAEVSSLQQTLVTGGHLVMPAGVAYGYFGALTQAAVAKWQAANGVAPAVGYWGPISRAKYASMAGPVVPGPSVPGVGITTPGVEGTITATVNPSPAAGTKLYEGDSKRAVLGIELEAKTSDIRIERVKLDLDHVTGTTVSDNNFYRKIAQKIYVMDGSTVLGSADLSVDTVVEDGANRFITIAGLNFIVPKDAKKVLMIALDARSNWDSDFDTETFSVGVPVDGVRGIDGAGVNQYSPSTAFSRNFTTEGELADSATLAVSLNSGTPVTQQVICATGTDEDECDNLEVARFDFRSTKDDVTVTDFVLDIVRGGTLTTATSSTAYIYDGSTLVGSASLIMTTTAAGTYTFSDIDWTVPVDSTRTLSVRFDIDDAGAAATTFVASTDADDVTAENASGTVVTATGSADGNTITIRNVGLEISLVSKSIVKASTPIQNNYSTSTAEATFTLNLKAVGGDIRIGTNASTTGALVENDGNGASVTSPSFLVFLGGTDVTATLATNASTTGFTIPTEGTTAEGTNSRVLSEGSSIQLPVSFLFEGKKATSVAITTGSYSVQLANVNWVSSGGLQASSFMADSLNWRTSSVSMP